MPLGEGAGGGGEYILPDKPSLQILLLFIHNIV